MGFGLRRVALFHDGLNRIGVHATRADGRVYVDTAAFRQCGRRHHLHNRELAAPIPASMHQFGLVGDERRNCRAFELIAALAYARLRHDVEHWSDAIVHMDAMVELLQARTVRARNPTGNISGCFSQVLRRSDPALSEALETGVVDPWSLVVSDHHTRGPWVLAPAVSTDRLFIELEHTPPGAREPLGTIIQRVVNRWTRTDDGLHAGDHVPVTALHPGIATLADRLADQVFAAHAEWTALPPAVADLARVRGGSREIRRAPLLEHAVHLLTLARAAGDVEPWAGDIREWLTTTTPRDDAERLLHGLIHATVRPDSRTAERLLRTALSAQESHGAMPARSPAQQLANTALVVALGRRLKARRATTARAPYARIARALAWLKRSQAPDGAWVAPGDEPDTPIHRTAWLVSLLAPVFPADQASRWMPAAVGYLLDSLHTLRPTRNTAGAITSSAALLETLETQHYVNSPPLERPMSSAARALRLEARVMVALHRAAEHVPLSPSDQALLGRELADWRTRAPRLAAEREVDMGTALALLEAAMPIGVVRAATTRAARATRALEA